MSTTQLTDSWAMKQHWSASSGGPAQYDNRAAETPSFYSNCQGEYVGSSGETWYGWGGSCHSQQEETMQWGRMEEARTRREREAAYGSIEIRREVRRPGGIHQLLFPGGRREVRRPGGAAVRGHTPLVIFVAA